MRTMITFQRSAAEFLSAVERTLGNNEERYGLLLGLARRLASSDAMGSEYVFATLHDKDASDRIVGTVMRTPGHKVLLSDLPVASIPSLAEAIATRLDQAPGVQGEPGRARLFAEAWSTIRPVTVREGRAQRIYVLNTVIPPRPCAGNLRAARPSDRALLTRWFRSFMVDVGSVEPIDLEAYIDRVLNGSNAVIWACDGDPVSLATTSRETPRGASVSLVYTPPEHRGKGFASNVTAALSQRLLDRGKEFTTLYADAANVTTNSIYPKIGYEFLADELEIWFDELTQ